MFFYFTAILTTLTYTMPSVFHFQIHQQYSYSCFYIIKIKHGFVNRIATIVRNNRVNIFKIKLNT